MGYVSERTKTIAVGRDDKNFYHPDIQHVLNKEYPLSRPLYFYVNGEPAGVLKQFIDFTLSHQGQQQFAETGFVPMEVKVAQEN
jgi:phosphate transport system substrate-binding protein